MHHVQDLIFTIGNIIFAIALIPLLRSPNKPALSTSLATGLTLLTFAICYATLSLWFSVIAASLTAYLWLTLAWQKYRQPRNNV